MDAHQRMEDIYKGLDRRERFRKGRREKDWKEEVEEGRRRWKREGGGGGGGGGVGGGGGEGMKEEGIREGGGGGGTRRQKGGKRRGRKEAEGYGRTNSKGQYKSRKPLLLTWRK